MLVGKLKLGGLLAGQLTGGGASLGYRGTMVIAIIPIGTAIAVSGAVISTAIAVAVSAAVISTAIATPLNSAVDASNAPGC